MADGHRERTIYGNDNRSRHRYEPVLTERCSFRADTMDRFQSYLRLRIKDENILSNFGFRIPVKGVLSISIFEKFETYCFHLKEKRMN